MRVYAGSSSMNVRCRVAMWLKHDTVKVALTNILASLQVLAQLMQATKMQQRPWT